MLSGLSCRTVRAGLTYLFTLRGCIEFPWFPLSILGFSFLSVEHLGAQDYAPSLHQGHRFGSGFVRVGEEQGQVRVCTLSPSIIDHSATAVSLLQAHPHAHSKPPRILQNRFAGFSWDPSPVPPSQGQLPKVCSYLLFSTTCFSALSQSLSLYSIFFLILCQNFREIFGIRRFKCMCSIWKNHKLPVLWILLCHLCTYYVRHPSLDSLSREP